MRPSSSAKVSNGFATVSGLRAAPRSALGRAEPPVPAPRTSVPRVELLARIRNSTAPVLIVDAPAGYGKSTLLRQWAATEPRPVEWIQLAESHNDPAALLESILGALNAVEDVEPTLSAGPLDDRTFLDGVALPRLTRLLRSRARPMVAVLDGAESLSSPDAWKVVSALLEAASPETFVVLAGRARPPLPLGRWVTRRRLLWLRRDDLLLSPFEAAALLDAAGVPHRPEVLEPLVEHCAGWAAGLATAAAVVAGTPDAAAAALDFSGASGPMCQYLRANIVDPLPSSVRRFMTASSVLGVLTGDRCDAVLAVTGSGIRLAELSRSNVLLEAVGHQPDHFRYLPLLKDLLRHDLAVLEPQQESALHRRASRSYAEEGAIDEAVKHARAAGDAALAAELVWPRVAQQRTPGERPLDRWLDTFTTPELQASPRLALASAWRALESGRPLEHWLSVAARTSTTDSPDVTGTSVRGGLSLFRAVFAQHGADRMADDADRAIELSGDDTWRCMACHVAGVARLLLGDPAGARRGLREGEQLSRLLDVPSVEAQCVAYQAVMAIEDEQWASAEALSNRAAFLIERFRLPDEVSMMTAFAAVAVVSARRGERQEAEHAVRRVRQLLARTPSAFAPWMQIDTRILLVRAQLLLGDGEAARLLLTEADAALRRTALATPAVEGKLRHVRRMAEHLPLTTPGGPTGLTAAELRVLRLLPTHLSFREIGDLVFLSRNTVKTQAIATYRKLGVNSRAEAVSAARTRGLLGE